MPQLTTNPQAQRDMVKLDSTIRETLRLHPMFGHGLTRHVVAPGGITTPDGLYLPQGCAIALDVVNTQMASCEKGQEYQPLRFYHEAGNNSPAKADSPLKKQTPTVQISDDFLAFGLGKYACPGRFFAVQTVKLMLGYLVTHYDFEPLAERPKPVEIGDVQTSPKTVLKVRRRKLSSYQDGSEKQP